MKNLTKVMNEITNEIIEMTNDTMEMCNCSMEDCFPVYVTKKVGLNGKIHLVKVKIF